MWYQLHLILDQPDVQRVSELLDETGATAVTLSDAGSEDLLEPAPNTTPLWRKVRATGLYAADVDMDSVVGALRSELDHCDPGPAISVLSDRQWEREWMDKFTPTCFGGRLWVLPSWSEDVGEGPDTVSMRLDPGLAFGTGTHETTALCLDWLAHCQLSQASLVDYGCGSGILAIAAAKLGARAVWAVDLDAQALRAARQNVASNNVADVVEVVLPSELPRRSVDVLVSNILAAPLIALAPDFARTVSSGGQIVLAGLLVAQIQEVIRAYETWFNFEQPVQRGDWVRLCGSRREVQA